ncbi:UPF0641 membrane protein like [Actinidia chinensis var. chinensis]|uniref:UPF0641 membrane protein like n=1 Tax=Actinidia chinensis var. chinensis TaxID=1590841 RepID=A0A2R6REQ6_ACTCC|nr:UPF0641 membrane protein like [Actinidia chinensis var. chinensis]
MSSDTTAPSYWLNWRFLICAIWILTSMVVSAILIWKYEGSKKSKTGRRHNWRDTVGSLYKDEAWRTSLKVVHPAWLLAYRVMAFIMLLALLIINVVLDGAGIFYFYTQWTFTLVTVYFGIASLFSIYGCFQCRYEVGGDGADHVPLDEEQGTCVSPTLAENDNFPNTPKNMTSQKESGIHIPAGVWGYVFQIIYQISAGAVLLTDCVFWFIIYPFLTSDATRLGFMDVSMHSLNAIFLLGDVLLNCLRFPFFRISYFILWTGMFVIFQWIIHACVSMWWPYPFLDLSSPYAPLWYMGVGLLHFPCYAVFALIIRLKHFCLARFAPDTL